MTTDIIYEEPKLNVFQQIKKLWSYAPIYSKGFTKGYKQKMEAKTNGERIQEGQGEVREVPPVNIKRPRQEISPSGGTKVEEEKVKLTFYDFKTKQKFESNNYEIEYRSNRKYAVATAPSGSKTWRAMKK